MKLSDYIAEYLANRGINVMFGYTGGSIADLVDSVCCSSKIKFVENYHEQASAFAANAYALLSQKPSVCVATSGPGACNLINGIANAFFDSIPCVFITGNAHSMAARPNSSIRQNAFQETDIVSMVKGITKYAAYLDNPENIKYELDKAFYEAENARKGPVLIDIPYDIMRKDIKPESLKAFYPEAKLYDDCDEEKVVNIIKDSKRPLILLGGGALGCREKLFTFVSKAKIPVISSLRALDLFPHENDYFVGFIGSYGNRWANLAVKYCDMLLVLGSRLDERQMGNVKHDFAPNAQIIRVDIDECELPRKVDAFCLHLATEKFLDLMVEKDIKTDCKDWLSVIHKWREDFPSVSKTKHEAGRFIDFISRKAKPNTVFCSDVGQNQMCVAQSIYLDDGKRLINSAGLGAMGFSLPAAIGAAYFGAENVISFNGDGGIQMNIQELQTVKRDDLPIHIIVMNNHCLGMIRKLQEKLFEQRYHASIYGFSSPDFCKLADAYGLLSYKVLSVDDYVGAAKFVLDNRNGLIEVDLPVVMQANPEPYSKIYEQSPLLSDVEKKRVESELENIL